MQTTSCFSALNRLEACATSDEVRDNVVAWAERHGLMGMAARMAWAADRLENHETLPASHADLEEAYGFDAAAQTVRTFVDAMAQGEAA